MEEVERAEEVEHVEEVERKKSDKIGLALYITAIACALIAVVMFVLYI